MKFGKILSLFTITCISICVFGCSNFLGGAGLKDEIESKIEYANAGSVDIEIKTESGTGIVSPNQSITKKVGDFFTLSFEPNSDYAFAKWQVFDKNNKVVTDAVRFDYEDKPETKAELKKLEEGLKIIPKCVKRPKVIEAVPQKESMLTSSLKIIFDEPIDVSSFRFTESEIPAGAEPLYDNEGLIYSYVENEAYYYKNISITSGNGINRNENYGMPFLSANGKQLIIPVNRKNLPDTSFGTVSVAIGSDIHTTESELATLLNKYNFNFKYNNKTDTTAPLISEFSVKNTETDKNLTEYISSIPNEFYDVQNIVSSVYLTATVTDENDIQ